MGESTVSGPFAASKGRSVVVEVLVVDVLVVVGAKVVGAVWGQCRTARAAGHGQEYRRRASRPGPKPLPPPATVILCQESVYN